MNIDFYHGVILRLGGFKRYFPANVNYIYIFRRFINFIKNIKEFLITVNFRN